MSSIAIPSFGQGAPRAFNRRRTCWLFVFVAALGIAGHFVMNPLATTLVAGGHRATVEMLAAKPEVPGRTQNSRMEYSFSGELPEPPGSLTELQQRLRLSWARAWLALLALCVLGILARYRTAFASHLRQLFVEQEHPYTLALLRIFVFGWLLSSFDAKKFLLLADFPRELAMPPPGLGWALSGPLISAPVMAITGQLFVIFCFLAMVGLCTRVSAALAIAVGLYVGGIPKLFGATVYQHCIYWFGAICAAAPSGDALSLDALITAFRRPTVGLARAGERRAAYAIPLRVIWLLFAVIYFFPGFWKLWHCGFDWARSSHLAGVMHARWLDAEKMPALRIDRMPLLLTLGTINTLIFELGFAVAVLFRRTRYWALAEGALFHWLNRMFLYFNFLHIVYCYLAFFDWRSILSHCGRWIFGAPLPIVVSAQDIGALRTAALLRTVDLLDTLAVEQVAPAGAGPGFTLRRGASSRSGMSAVWATLLRLPLAWPLLPVLGPLIYHLLRRGGTPGSAISPAVAPERAARLALAVGMLILVASTLVGAVELDRGWPFACYPPFAWRGGEYRHILRITTTNAKGEQRQADETQLTKKLGPQHKAQLFGLVLLTAEEELRNRRLFAMWKLYQRLDPKLADIVRVQFDEVTVYFDPASPSESVSRRLATWFADAVARAKLSQS